MRSGCGGKRRLTEQRIHREPQGAWLDGNPFDSKLLFDRPAFERFLHH